MVLTWIFPELIKFFENEIEPIIDAVKRFRVLKNKPFLNEPFQTSKTNPNRSGLMNP